ncbi:hypothetical protein MKW92_049937, partial [Papaver armeniacum]
TKVKGAAKSNKRKGTASFVGECSTRLNSEIAPSSAPASTGPSMSQNFFAIGSVSQNIKQGTENGKSKKK